MQPGGVWVLELMHLGNSLFALRPFYFCHTKTGRKRMHRQTHLQEGQRYRRDKKEGHREKATSYAEE